jgi:hypothetical protein
MIAISFHYFVAGPVFQLQEQQKRVIDRPMTSLGMDASAILEDIVINPSQ